MHVRTHTYSLAHTHTHTTYTQHTHTPQHTHTHHNTHHNTHTTPHHTNTRTHTHTHYRSKRIVISMALQFCFSLRAFPFVDNLQEIVITVVSSVLSVSSVLFLYPPVTKLEGGGSILFVARTMCAFCFVSFRKSGVLCIF